MPHIVCPTLDPNWPPCTSLPPAALRWHALRCVPHYIRSEVLLEFGPGGCDDRTHVFESRWICKPLAIPPADCPDHHVGCVSQRPWPVQMADSGATPVANGPEAASGTLNLAAACSAQEPLHVARSMALVSPGQTVGPTLMIFLFV